MAFLDTLKNTFAAACDTVNGLAQSFLEKQRVNSKLNRLRSVMKNESELMNRAYIALGKGYYEQIKKGEKPQTEREEKLVKLIDNCKAKMARARDCYRQIIESQNEVIYSSVGETKEQSFEKDDVVDITVACSNESDYASSPFNGEKAETSAAPVESAPAASAPVESAPAEQADEESPDGEPF